MNDIIIITVLVTTVLLICGGIGLWVFIDWLENNGEDQ